MNKKIFFLLLGIIGGILEFAQTFAQNNVGIGTFTPNPKAILELKSSDKGFLVPRMDSIGRVKIYPNQSVNLDGQGMLVYDTLDQNFWYFDGYDWKKAMGSMGAQGIPGLDGKDGVDGKDGKDGIDGKDGADGQQGPTGADGLQGPAGNDGATGAQGVAGPTGPVNMDSIFVQTANFDTIFSSYASFDSLLVQIAQFDTLFSNYASFDSLLVQIAQFDTLYSNYASFDSLFVQLAQFDTLYSNQAYFDSVFSQYASFDSLVINGIGINTLIDSLISAAGTMGATGATGADGIQGTAGKDGVNGATGATGANGTNGTNGINGATGATGKTGATGITGNTGASGANGTNGVNGATGSTGATGATGITGVAGTNGTNGVTGATGVTGAAGTNGINGTNGAIGATGATGITGAAGTNGINGATGKTGATGITGSAGANGTNGATGVAGATGATGATGTDGAKNAWALTGNAGTIVGTNFIGTTDVQDFVVKTNNSERIRFTSGGNVGIGTTSPIYPLSISNTTNVRTLYLKTTHPSSGQVYGIYNDVYSGGTSGLRVGIYNDVEASNGIYNTILSYNRSTLGGTSLVKGIYNFFPEVAGSNNPITSYDTYIDVDNSHTSILTGFDATIKSAGSGIHYGMKATLDNAGTGTHFGVYADLGGYTNGWAGYFIGQGYFSDNVGIGTTSSTQKLHINGNMRLTGAFYDLNNSAGTSGQVLSTTGAGTDWVDASTLFLNAWSLSGNSGTTAGTDFIGTTDAKALVFKTNSVEAMRISSTGNVSIGSTSTSYKLYVEETDNNVAAWIANTNSPDAYPYGLYAKVVSGATATRSTAVSGWADGSAGENRGVSGSASNTTATSNFGVYGYAYNATTNYGVFGNASSSSGYAVYAQGDLVYTGTSYSVSDRRLKTNVAPMTNALDKILKLQPKTYNFKTEEYKHMNLAEGQKFGLISQEVEQVIPEIVHNITQPDTYDENGKLIGEKMTFKGLDYTSLVPVLISAIQEQQIQIEELKKQVELLKQGSNSFQNKK